MYCGSSIKEVLPYTVLYEDQLTTYSGHQL
jgi:hypothetical protein